MGTELITFPTSGFAISIAVGANGLIVAGDSTGCVCFLRVHDIDLT